MAQGIILALVGLFCTAASSILTFILTRRKYNSEVGSQEIKNIDSSFEVYKKVMNESLKAQDMKIAVLEKENDSLRQQVNELQTQVISLVSTIYGNRSNVTGKIEPLSMKDM